MKIKFGLFIVPLIALSCAEHVAQAKQKTAYEIVM